MRILTYFRIKEFLIGERSKKMVKDTGNNVKGANNMSINSGTNNVNIGKGVNNSPLIQQDINNLFAINTGITPQRTAHNEFYDYIHQHYSNKSTAKLPYLADNKVFRADNKYLKCIADGHIKISPYGFYEGAASAARTMYVNTLRLVHDKVNFQFLVQSYLLYTSLCLGIASNGQIDIITSSNNVINAIPANESDKKGAIQRANPVTDDYVNGIVQCVELIPRQCGYALKPAIINAAKQDYVILPVAWVEYLTTYISNLLKMSVCKLSFYDPNNNLQTAIVTNKPIKGNYKHYIGCDYIKHSKSNVGWIRAVEIKSGDIISLPVSHFHRIEMLK